MYKVFCDNSRLRLFFDEDTIMPEEGKSLKISTIALSVAMIKFWLEQPDKADLDLCVKDFSSAESVLNQVFDWRFAAGGAVLVGDKLLTILRNGIPDLPKGHIDAGEIARIAALREVSEETGVRKSAIAGALPTTFHCYRIDGLWILKKTSWFFMYAKADFLPAPQLDEGITDVQLLAEEEFDAFFSKTYRAISEELSKAIRQQYKSMHPK